MKKSEQNIESTNLRHFIFFDSMCHTPCCLLYNFTLFSTLKNVNIEWKKKNAIVRTTHAALFKEGLDKLISSHLFFVPSFEIL